eukprot:jgi/Hompol1/642/HPOL_005382-RA
MAIQATDGVRYTVPIASLKTTARYYTSVSFDGTDTLEGTIVSDTVGLADQQSFTSQNIGQCVASFMNSDFDGIFGLGLPGSSLNGLSTPLQDLANQGLLPANIFGLFLATGDSTASALTLGGTDPSFTSADINWVPLTPGSQRWQVTLDSLAVLPPPSSVFSQLLNTSSQPTVIASGMQAVFDTGTSLIAMPVQYADAIHALLAPSVLFNNRLRLIPCMNMPSISIKLNGIEFILTNADYIIPFGFGYCVSAFVGLNIENVIVLGDTFLRKYYSVFDVDGARVGLVKL